MKFFRLLTVLCILASCSGEEKKPVMTSFYYWRTSFQLSEPEINAMKKSGASELYVRFFDVDKENDSIVPVGIINGVDRYPEFIEIVPVIFIINRTFINARPSDISTLAKRITAEINSQLKRTRAVCKSIQFDCDWSGRTRDNYFLFLSEFKKLNARKIVSATIRLHQTKYVDKTGVPPADRGVLMYYNMGELGDDSLNSIYNAEDAAKYSGFAKNYPLELDVALPIFSWFVHKHNGKIKSLVKEIRFDLSDTSSFFKDGRERFIVKRSFLNDGNYYEQGDELKSEKLTSEELLKLAGTAASDINNDHVKLIFFHLDEANLKNYDDKTIEEIRSLFN